MAIVLAHKYQRQLAELAENLLATLNLSCQCGCNSTSTSSIEQQQQ